MNHVTQKETSDEREYGNEENSEKDSDVELIWNSEWQCVRSLLVVVWDRSQNVHGWKHELRTR